MKIEKTSLDLSGTNDGTIWLVDTIEHQGRLWLVPEWLASPTEGFQTPKRIICLSALKHQVTPNHPRFQYLLNAPLPIAVFEGRAQPEEAAGYEVVEAPSIRIEIPKGIH